METLISGAMWLLTLYFARCMRLSLDDDNDDDDTVLLRLIGSAQMRWKPPRSVTIRNVTSQLSKAVRRRAFESLQRCAVVLEAPYASAHDAVKS